MNFCENLINLRKKHNLSQEVLADKLGVSRQAVSKWESGNSYPEMDKLLILCDLFNCTMDELVKGKITIESNNIKDTFTIFYNKFSLAIASGVSLILFGIVVMLSLYYFMNEASTIPVAVFMIFVLIAVSIFILYGLGFSDFREKYGYKSPFTVEDYHKELSPIFNRAMVIGVALILFGVIFIILTGSNLVDQEITTLSDLKTSSNYISVIIFMFLVTVAVFLFIYYGIQRMKYKFHDYSNEKYMVDVDKVSKYSGVIMILATMIYLILGFIFDLWHPGWIVFPLGGMLCGVVSTIFTKIDNDK